MKCDLLSGENLEEFKIEQKYCRYINGGTFGEVYRLTKNHAGKFLYYPDFEGLKYEHNICRIADNGNVSVPKSEGVFNVMHPKKKIICPSFVMEYVKGPTLEEIFEKEGKSILFYDVEKLANKEIKKARKLNLISRDADRLSNIIWNPKKEKVYLIDFGCWRVIE